MNIPNIPNRPTIHPHNHRLAAVCLALLCAGATSVRAATILVTIAADDGGGGTLREALANATDGDTIDATGISGTIVLRSGELVVSKSVTILGPGPATLAVDGNGDRVFLVQNGGTATIASLTITHGFAGSLSGGGIYNDHSTLTVSNCTVTSNTVTTGGFGGGIFNDGSSGGSATLTIIASTISGNTSKASDGGGIYNYGASGSATLTVIASTLSGNLAFDGYGGGIYNNGSNGTATLTVSASTLSSNLAYFNGSGIYNNGESGNATLTVSASTLSDDLSSGVFDIVNDGFGGIARMEIGDTILNAGAFNRSIANVGDVVTSRGYNLSSDGGVDNGLGGSGALNATGDQINTDPLLGPLQDNGGPTFTHALLTGSPAIDKGKRDAIPALALNTDQRGSPRPLDDPSIANATGGDGSDIGAFEGAVSPPVAKCKDVSVGASCNGGDTDASIDDGSFDPKGGPVTLSQSPAGPYPVGTTLVTLTVTDSLGASASCQASVTVANVPDTDAPRVQCRPAPSPTSGKISEPGKNGSTGVNPNGYYQMLAKDNCDANPLIYVKDTGSAFVAGPFKDGDIVRIKHTGGAPSSAPGTAPVVAVINLNGNGLEVATDVTGNTTPDASGCLMQASITK